MLNALQYIPNYIVIDMYIHYNSHTKETFALVLFFASQLSIQTAPSIYYPQTYRGA